MRRLTRSTLSYDGLAAIEEACRDGARSHGSRTSCGRSDICYACTVTSADKATEVATSFWGHFPSLSEAIECDEQAA